MGRAARSPKAWSNNPPTLISAVSFYIHHVSIICFYGNRLGSQPNAFRPFCFLSLIVIRVEDLSEMFMCKVCSNGRGKNGIGE